MTSKRLFFRVMREDLRHRVWMMVMSALAGFLLPSVTWLLYRENLLSQAEGRNYMADQFVWMVRDVLEIVILPLGSMVGICGALIAAFAGFRFMLHRDQVDTWHSLPVKRDMLFWVCYLNGALIWLLPLFAGVVLVGVLSGNLLTTGGDLTLFADTLKLALLDFGVLIVIFLLVYNLALTAMMFSGNMLNTIVSMLILGVGAISCYGLNIGLHERYLQTYLAQGGNMLRNAIYASPLFSVFLLIMDRGEIQGNFHLWIYVLETAALGGCAWLLYRRRPSELAEQGIRSRIFAGVLRLTVTAAAGVGGWLFFYAVSNERGVWAVFGAILALALVHGVLNVVFCMEFRAFFAHKAQLGCVAAAVLFVCFSFQRGWFGYDAYCPAKEEIAEIGLLVEHLTNRFRDEMGDPLTEIKYRDGERIFALLQKLSRHSAEGHEGPRESMEIRVTLKSGRTYYRRYQVCEAEWEALLPVVKSREYLEYLYFLDERLTESGSTIRLHVQQDTTYSGERDFTLEELQPLFQAYNQDILEEPETTFMGKGRIQAGVSMTSVNRNGYSLSQELELEIYDSMSRTVEALRQLGYAEQMTPRTAAEIAAIELTTGRWVNAGSADEIIAAVRERYGVPEDGSGEASAGGNREAAEVQTADESRREVMLSVTDPGEIDELLALISYTYDYRVARGLKSSMVSVEMTYKDGRRSKGYLRKGDLPEKYILRFGELAEK